MYSLVCVVDLLEGRSRQDDPPASTRRRSTIKIREQDGRMGKTSRSESTNENRSWEELTHGILFLETMIELEDYGIGRFEKGMERKRTRTSTIDFAIEFIEGKEWKGGTLLSVFNRIEKKWIEKRKISGRLYWKKKIWWYVLIGWTRFLERGSTNRNSTTGTKSSSRRNSISSTYPWSMLSISFIIN